jgi:hypothetical protein
MPLSMKRWVVIVLAALLFAVALSVLLVPHSWAAAYEWYTNLPQSSPCGCVLEPGSDG